MSNWTQYDSDASINALKWIANETEGTGAARVALLESAKDSQTFLAHVKSLIKDGGGRLHSGKDAPHFSEKMDEPCYKNLSWKIQGPELWDSMKDMPPIDACRPGLWLYVTLDAIDKSVIESHYLAAGTNGVGDTGLARIGDALQPGKDKAALDLTRLVLRRMFGAISQRGNKAVFTDIPFAKIWWQRYIAEKIAQGGVDISADDMTNFLASVNAKRKGVYEELTMRMSSRLTVIADSPIRDGLMHFFYGAAKKENCPPGFSCTVGDFKKLVRRLGIMLAWRAMGAMEAMENSAITGECAAEIGRGEFA